MSPEVQDISQAQAQTDLQNQFPIRNKSFSVFDESGVYISGKRIFFSYFESLPSVMFIRNIHSEKAIQWVEQNLGDIIVHRHYKVKSLTKTKFVNVVFVLKNELVIDIEDDSIVALLFTENSKKEAKAFEIALRKLTKRGSHSRSINLITESRFGLDLLPIKCTKPKLDLSLNYNDDLIDTHKHLIQELNRKNKSGLVLLHGIPGSGKSTYIRYLIHSIKKTVIFLPPKIAAHLDSPSMTSLLVENPKSIFIIEDAEELIKSREGKNDSCISMLLNLTDGMLGDSLGIQVICTFNTNVKNIDKALLRKGRLITSYEFKELQANKSKILLKRLGVNNYIADNNMTLAEIYNSYEKPTQIDNIAKHIGFLTNIDQ